MPIPDEVGSLCWDNERDANQAYMYEAVKQGEVGAGKEKKVERSESFHFSILYLFTCI